MPLFDQLRRRFLSTIGTAFGRFPSSSFLLSGGEKSRPDPIGTAIERKAGWRFGIAGGVPYLSLTELPNNSDAVLAKGMVDSERNCDHQCRIVRKLSGAPDQWERAIARAKPRWQDWLQASHQIDAGGRLQFGKESGEIVATSVSALIEELEE